MPVIITRSLCSTRKSSTSANTPAPMPSISGRRTISTRSPGRFRVFPRWPRRASIFAASASRSCAKAGLEGAGSQFHLYVWGAGLAVLRIVLRYRADQLERLGAPGPDAPWHAESSQRTAAPGLRTGARRHRKRHQCARRLPACRPDTAQVQCRWVLLPQPFKLTRVGPVNLFVDDYEALKRWHTDVLSFTLTEEIEWQGEQCAYLRCDNEHHSLGIFPKSWRKNWDSARRRPICHSVFNSPIISS